MTLRLQSSYTGQQSSGSGPHYLPVTVTRSDRESGEAHPIAQVIGPDRIELIGKQGFDFRRLGVEVLHQVLEAVALPG